MNLLQEIAEIKRQEKADWGVDVLKLMRKWSK